MPERASNRWHATAINHRIAATASLMALCAGALSYEVPNVASLDTMETTRAMILAIAFLALSFTTGLAILVTRDSNFRVTARVARNRENGATPAALNPDRSRYKRLGAQTHRLFALQIWLFAAAIVFLSCHYVPILLSKLPPHGM